MLDAVLVARLAARGVVVPEWICDPPPLSDMQAVIDWSAQRRLWRLDYPALSALLTAVEDGIDAEIKLAEQVESARRFARDSGLADKEFADLCGGPRQAPRPAPIGSTLALQTVARMGVIDFFAAPDARLLVLIGGTGSGKTCAAAEGLLMARQNGKTARWMTASDFSRLPPWGEFPAGLTQVRLLVIDDLGSELDAGKTPALLKTLLCERFRREARTILTANLSRPEVTDRYLSDERVKSRMGDAGIVECGNVDLRQKGDALRRNAQEAPG